MDEEVRKNLVMKLGVLREGARGIVEYAKEMKDAGRLSEQEFRKVSSLIRTMTHYKSRFHTKTLEREARMRAEVDSLIGLFRGRAVSAVPQSRTATKPKQTGAPLAQGYVKSTAKA